MALPPNSQTAPPVDTVVMIAEPVELATAMDLKSLLYQLLHSLSKQNYTFILFILDPPNFYRVPLVRGEAI